MMVIRRSSAAEQRRGQPQAAPPRRAPTSPAAPAPRRPFRLTGRHAMLLQSSMAFSRSAMRAPGLIAPSRTSRSTSSRASVAVCAPATKLEPRPGNPTTYCSCADPGPESARSFRSRHDATRCSHCGPDIRPRSAASRGSVSAARANRPRRSRVGMNALERRDDFAPDTRGRLPPGSDDERFSNYRRGLSRERDLDPARHAGRRR